MKDSEALSDEQATNTQSAEALKNENDKKSTGQSDLISSNYLSEFTILLEPPQQNQSDVEISNENFPIVLGSSSIKQIGEHYGKMLVGKELDDGRKEYNLEITYNGYRSFDLKMKTYYDNQTKNEIIYYIGVDDSVGMNRGTVYTVADLIRKYPDSLYSIELDSTQISESKFGEYDSVYSYIPDPTSGSDITIYFKNGYYVYGELYYGQEGCRWKNKSNVRGVNKTDQDICIETVKDYHETLWLPCNYDVNGDGVGFDLWDCKVDYKIPKLSSNMPDADLINIALNVDEYCNDLKEFAEGKYPNRFGGEPYSYVFYDYKVYQYNGLSALVTEQGESLHEGGSSSEYYVFYFDNETGKQISAQEYARRNSITNQEILKKYNKAIDHEFFYIHSIYDAGFYMDEAGVLQVSLEGIC